MSMILRDIHDLKTEVSPISRTNELEMSDTELWRVCRQSWCLSTMPPLLSITAGNHIYIYLVWGRDGTKGKPDVIAINKFKLWNRICRTKNMLSCYFSGVRIDCCHVHAQLWSNGFYRLKFPFLFRPNQAAKNKNRCSAAFSQFKGLGGGKRKGFTEVAHNKGRAAPATLKNIMKEQSSLWSFLRKRHLCWQAGSGHRGQSLVQKGTERAKRGRLWRQASM